MISTRSTNHYEEMMIVYCTITCNIGLLVICSTIVEIHSSEQQTNDKINKGKDNEHHPYKIHGHMYM